VSHCNRCVMCLIWNQWYINIIVCEKRFWTDTVCRSRNHIIVKIFYWFYNEIFCFYFTFWNIKNTSIFIVNIFTSRKVNQVGYWYFKFSTVFLIYLWLCDYCFQVKFKKTQYNKVLRLLLLIYELKKVGKWVKLCFITGVEWVIVY